LPVKKSSCRVFRVVRRLKVINTPASADAEASARPRWQWVVLGGALALTTFLPLCMIGLWVGARLRGRFDASPGLAHLLGAAPILLAFAVAAWSAGVLVGRFGGRTTGRDGALGGVLGGSLLLLLAGLGGALRPASLAASAALVLLAAGALFGGLGARFGTRRRA